MSYDYGLKKISKYTGLTGIESKNIANAFKTKNLDVESVDWKTIGEDIYGYGKRSSSVKKKLASMYGIDLGVPQSSMGHEIKKHSDMQHHSSMSELMGIFESRSRLSKRMDLKIAAKGTFAPSDREGVKLWKKYPNQYDIIGIDDPV